MSSTRPITLPFIPILSAALLVALSSPIGAQDKPNKLDKPQAKPEQPAVAKPAAVPLSMPTLALATQLKGVNIVDANKKTLGEIEDVIAESSGGSLAVVDRDRADGGGLIVLPMEQLEARLDKGDVKDANEDASEGKRPEAPQVEAFLLRAKAELFATAPAFEKDRLATLDAAAIEGIRKYWTGKESEPGAAKPATPATPAAPATPATASTAAHGTQLCVEHAVGKDVKSPTDEKLGQIKDVVIDLPTGKAAYVVIASGGVLGVGETFHGVPLDALAVAGQDGYTLHTDLKTLDNSPGIDLDRLPSRPSLQISAKVSLTDGSDAQRTPR